LRGLVQVGGDHGDHHAVLVEDVAGGFDDVGAGETVDHVGGREFVAEQPGRIEAHDVFAILGADDLDPVNALDAVQARRHVVLRDIGEFGQVAGGRTQADIGDRKGAGGQQPRVDHRAGGQ
jgi:hypothetical protein